MSLHDSGERKVFESGAVRDRAPGKGRYDALQVLALRRIALIMEKADAKYGDCRNWEKGMPISMFMDSAKRHLDQYIEGLTDEDHLGQAAWNILSAMQTEEMINRGLLPADLLDMPSFVPKSLPGSADSYIHSGLDQEEQQRRRDAGCIEWSWYSYDHSVVLFWLYPADGFTEETIFNSVSDLDADFQKARAALGTEADLTLCQLTPSASGRWHPRGIHIRGIHD